MAGKFDGMEDEEDVLAPKEPQVTSQHPAERKEGRALRIKRRQDALKRAEQPLEEIAAEEEPGLIEQATSLAARELQRLEMEGAAKVTNVKVTTDEREVMRRGLFSEKMTSYLEQIECEAAEAQLQYEAITSNWDSMLKIKDPLDIDTAIQEQREKCDHLLQEKDVLIAELKEGLKHMDAAYYEDLDKQDQDIKELSERIEKQVSIMQKAYEKQLFLIEQAITIEREVMVEHNNKRWEALYKQRDREELVHMDLKEEQLEEHKLNLEAIMWEHHDKYRVAKIELETLLQELQRELEKLKATCLINTEKIGYNYQILKKREEENVFVRSQQKRKLNKMSDVAAALRSRIRRAAEDGAAEEMRADAEINRLMQMMGDLEKKTYHFSQVNDYKFNQLWRMSAQRCGALSREIRRAEVAVHAHILSEPPPPPPPPPPPRNLCSAKDENECEDPENNVVAVPSSVVTCRDLEDPNDDMAKDSKMRLVRHILGLVADNTGFLIEDRLFSLIEKYNLNSRNLCTLDAIFLALEIQAEEDIEILCKTFLKYAFCPICVGNDTDVSELFDNEAMMNRDDRQPSVCASSKTGKSEKTMRGRSSVCRSMSASTSRSVTASGYMRGHDMTPSDHLMMTEADEIIQKCGDPQEVKGWSAMADAAPLARRGARGVTVTSQPMLSELPTQGGNPYLCTVGHPLEIEPMQVLTALGEFISVFVGPEKEKLNEILESLAPPDFSSPSRKLSREDIESYWAQWKSAFPPEKDRFWDGMLTGMNNYLHVLQDRERLHCEVVSLRARNSQLRRLVRGALPALPPRAAPAVPAYLRPAPPAFTAAAADMARLPPI